MPESFEQPKNPIYPTKSDVLELERTADTKATGANIHEVNGTIHIIRALIELAETTGWDQKKLNRFYERKKKLFEILSGVN